MRPRLAAILAAVLVLAPVTPTEAAGPAVRPVHPEVADLAEALAPPGARPLFGVFRVAKGLNARNKVYREARHVQRDLRTYYDAQIATAQEQLRNREQLGLVDSQVRAYTRVATKLRAEREAALGITEDEKRAAKYGFESTLKIELTEAIVRIPRVRDGLARTKDAIGDLQGAFERAKAALEGGNPITELVGEVREKLERAERFAEFGSMINGRFGERLSRVTATVRAEVDKIDRAVDEAIGAGDTAIAELDDVVAGIDQTLASTRTPRADLAVREAATDAIERIIAPRGPEPERDVLADALARNQLTAAQRAAGVATGAIDPSDFRRMRDRVHAATLGRSLERIADICGRLVGAARRLQLDAAAAGDPAPDTSTPCTLFGDPEALQALIDADRASATTDAPEPTAATAATVAPEPDPAPDGDSFTFRAVLAVEGAAADMVWEGTLFLADGVVSGNGEMHGDYDGTCSTGGGEESHVAYTVSGSFDITGTADDATMKVVLVPTGGSLDLVSGDLSVLCVEISVDVGRSLSEFPLGDETVVDGPVEVPVGGGATTVEPFPDFFFEVSVVPQ